MSRAARPRNEAVRGLPLRAVRSARLAPNSARNHPRLEVDLRYAGRGVSNRDCAGFMHTELLSKRRCVVKPSGGTYRPIRGPMRASDQKRKSPCPPSEGLAEVRRGPPPGAVLAYSLSPCAAPGTSCPIRAQRTPHTAGDAVLRSGDQTPLRRQAHLTVNLTRLYALRRDMKPSHQAHVPYG